jgi:hypothetical protein
MSVAQRIERDHPSSWDRPPQAEEAVEGDPAQDAAAYEAALQDIGPCGYGAIARHLGWGATRAGRAESLLRQTGRIVYDRTGRGRLVETTGIRGGHEP